MKKLLKQTLLLIIISTQALALDSGSLDTSFSSDLNTAGWDLIFESGGAVFATDTKVDSLGRVVVVGSLRNSGESNYHPFVRRYLANGQLDNMYISNIGNTNPTSVKVDISSYTNTIFVAFNYMNSSTNNLDIGVFYLDSNGTNIKGLSSVAFDLGGTDRKNDYLADLHVVDSFDNGEVYVTAEVERSNVDDTDFGIANLIYDESTEILVLDTSFSTDGMTNCAFDQASGGVGIDKPVTIKVTGLQTIIVGGSTFEGNGDNSDGWNISFCEFNYQGAVITQWSTLSPNSTASDSREFLADFAIDFGDYASDLSILALSKEPETDLSNEFDFAVRKYNYDGTTWVLDTTFGSGPFHVSRVGFVDGLLFPSATDDEPKRILIEPKDQQILVAGTSSWTGTNNENFSHMALAKLNKDGSLNTSWGTNQSGKAYVTLDNSFPQIFKDSLTSIAQDEKSEKIYISGINIAAGNQIYGSIARVHNDLIFKSGF